MKKFMIDSGSLSNIEVPKVQLNTHTENITASEFTHNCGCGGTAPIGCRQKNGNNQDVKQQN